MNRLLTQRLILLKIQIGKEIKLTESDFVHVFRAFFAEIETKFMQLVGVLDLGYGLKQRP